MRGGFGTPIACLATADIREIVLDEFLATVTARKGRWRDAGTEGKGIYPARYWTGQGQNGLEVAYGTAETKPNATTIREVWKRRHGHAAAPLLVVVSYSKEQPAIG